MQLCAIAVDVERSESPLAGITPGETPEAGRTDEQVTPWLHQLIGAESPNY